MGTVLTRVSVWPYRSFQVIKTKTEHSSTEKILIRNISGQLLWWLNQNF